MCSRNENKIEIYSISKTQIFLNVRQINYTREFESTLWAGSSGSCAFRFQSRRRVRGNVSDFMNPVPVNLSILLNEGHQGSPRYVTADSLANGGSWPTAQEVLAMKASKMMRHTATNATGVPIATLLNLRTVLFDRGTMIFFFIQWNNSFWHKVTELIMYEIFHFWHFK